MNGPGECQFHVVRRRERHGYRLAGDPESFLVNQRNTLLDGEIVRARYWGDTIGASATHLYRPAHA